MKNRLDLLIVVLLIGSVFYSNAGLASSPEDGLPASVKQTRGLIKNVYLKVDDQVKDNCWTNSKQIKEKARLTLEQSGIRVYDEPLWIITPFSVNLIISALGQRTDNGTCFGYINILAGRKILSNFGKATISYIGVNYEKGGTALSTTNLNSSFLETADTLVSGLAADIIAGRRSSVVKAILSKTPEKNTKPVTIASFLKGLKKASNSHSKP